MRIVTWNEFHNLNSMKQGWFFFLFPPILCYQNFGNFSSINIEKLIKFILGGEIKVANFLVKKQKKFSQTKPLWMELL
jgi:hypothetical protein